MTPQERDLVIELFDRLAELESAPRDREAERVIAEELNRAPHALYALVQTVLVQDEALKAADARIQELEGAPPPGAEEPRGFLDSMRESLFGRDERRGSVPSVRSGGEPMGVPPGFRRDAEAMGGPMPAPPEQGRGGSFLGTAAAAAAGVVGGAILANSIRSALGGHQSGQGPFAGAFDQLSPRGESPWGGRSGGGDLARDAGLDDIGRSGRPSGLYDSARNERPSEGAADEAAGYEDEGYDEEGYEEDGYDDGDEGSWDSGGDDVTEA